MRSVVLRTNPLALASVGMCAVGGSLAVASLRDGAVAVVLYALAIVLFTPSVRYALICLGLAIFAAATVFYSTWRLGGHDETLAATAALRIVMLAWPGAVVAGYIDPARFGDYLAQTLKFPARPVVAVTSAMQQVTSLSDGMSQIRRSRRARGISANGGPVARLSSAGHMVFSLLVASLRQSTERAVAMDARGFADAADRTWAEPATWSRLDFAAMAMAIGLAAVPLIV